MGKKRKLDWKPVALPESVISKGIDGLVGIEELCDYTIESNEIVNSSSSKPKRRKPMDSNDDKNERDLSVQEIQNNTGSWKITHIKTLEDDKQKSATHLNRKKNKKKKTQNKILLKNVGKSPFYCNLEVDVSQNDNDENILNIESSSSLGPVMKEDGKNCVPQGMEAWGSFNLPLPILQALLDLGFHQPTPIQELTLTPAIKGRRDILGAAETGSGKTLAFGIPIVYGILQQKKKSNAIKKQLIENKREDSSDDSANNQLKPNTNLETSDLIESDEESIDLDSNMTPSYSPERKLYALILTPTRELAIQVQNHLIAITKYTDIKVAAVIGGLASQKQERILKRGPEIVVATPGRLWEMIEGGNLHLEQVDDISFLAIDETDRMLEKGHFQELQTLLERINRNELKKEKRQNFVFSATLTSVHEPPKYLSNRKTPQQITPGQKLQKIISSLGITNPKVVDITALKGTAATLSEARIMCSINDKDYYLYYFLLRHPGRTLVFCNSISCVRRLAHILDILHCKPYPLHANMQQRQRLKNLERFRDNPTGLLLATDVAARGLDIPNVQHVIHFQVPRTTESYVHRSGRTARAQKEGITVLLMEANEVPFYLRLCQNLGRDHDLPDFPVEDSVFSAGKARVSLARQIDKLAHTSKRTSAEHGWFRKAAKEMDLEIDEDDIPHKMSEEVSGRMKRQMNGLKRQLLNLLNKPVIPKASSMKYPCLNLKDIKQTSAVAAVNERKNTTRNFVKILK